MRGLRPRRPELPGQFAVGPRATRPTSASRQVARCDAVDRHVSLRRMATTARRATVSCHRRVVRARLRRSRARGRIPQQPATAPKYAAESAVIRVVVAALRAARSASARGPASKSRWPNSNGITSSAAAWRNSLGTRPGAIFSADANRFRAMKSHRHEEVGALRHVGDRGQRALENESRATGRGSPDPPPPPSRASGRR